MHPFRIAPFVIYFLLAVPTTVFSQPTWSWQNPIPQGNNLTDIQFLDTLHGWAVGYNGAVVRTSTGGDQWEYVNTGFHDLFIRFSFADLQNGWAMSFRDNKVFRTIDGGSHWSKVADLDSLYSGTYHDIHFVNDTLGFVVGGSGRILRTTDGGLTWNPVPSSTNLAIYCIDFLDETYGWAGADWNTALKTTDGGLTWIPLPFFGFYAIAHGVHVLDPQAAYIAAGDENPIGGGEVGRALMTIDGGNTWLHRNFSEPLYDVYFSSRDSGWVADRNGRVYRTTNWGVSWELLDGKTHNFSFVDRDHSWGLTSFSQIVKSDDGWNSAVRQTQAATTRILWSVSVLDTLHAVACGQYKTIVGTADGGQTWTRYLSDSVNVDLQQVYYKSEQRILAVGSGGKLFLTQDGGNNWEEQNLGSGWLSGIDFRDEHTGFVVGRRGSNAAIYSSVDGGLTWKFHSEYPQISYFHKIRFSNPLLGYIISDSGVFRTVDGGDSWQLVHPASILFNDIDAHGDLAWAPYLNKVLYSTDAGNSWHSVQVFDFQGGIIRTIESITFTDERHGWLSVSDGRIYRTTDGGFTWTRDEQVAGVPLYSIRFLDHNNGWAVGSGGAIIHYGETVTGIPFDPGAHLPERPLLLRNYPNPFNPQTTIRFRLPYSQRVKLTVYDVQGRKIATLLNEQKPAGEHQIIFDGSRLASGIYICRLVAGGYEASQQMLLLK